MTIASDVDRAAKIAELRRLIGEGHASGVVDWEGGEDMLAKVQQGVPLSRSEAPSKTTR